MGHEKEGRGAKVESVKPLLLLLLELEHSARLNNTYSALDLSMYR